MVSFTGGLMVVAFVLVTSTGTAASFGPLSVSLRRFAGRSATSTSSLSSEGERWDGGGVGCLAEARRGGERVDEGLRELTMLLMVEDHDSCSTCSSETGVE
jgi:hypothetical protein